MDLSGGGVIVKFFYTLHTCDGSQQGMHLIWTFLFQMREPDWSSLEGLECFLGPQNRYRASWAVKVFFPRRILKNSISKIIFGNDILGEKIIGKSIHFQWKTMHFQWEPIGFSLKIHRFFNDFSSTILLPKNNFRNGII